MIVLIQTSFRYCPSLRQTVDCVLIPQADGPAGESSSCGFGDFDSGRVDLADLPALKSRKDA
jgi:hypothetical protein